MRRLMSLAAFALLLAVPLWAQHGGGHAAGGRGGGGFAGHSGFSGHAGGGQVSGGMHSSGMRSAPGASRGFTHAPSFSQRSFSRPPSANGGFHGSRNRTFGLRNNCRGFGCRSFNLYPYAYAGYYDPYWWDSGSSGYQNYDEAYERNRAVANEMNQQSLEEQQMRRQEEADGDRDIYAQSSPLSRPASGYDEPQGEAIIPATVLVFRDQHKQEIRNYAIVGQTLWSFGSPRTEKIPLADLDLAATTKANDERGLTFHVPAPNEAQ